MSDIKFISEDSVLLTYGKSDYYNKLTFFFNKVIKTVDIESQRFVLNDELTFIPQTEDNHSLKYGYWQVETPCLSMEDVKFLHSKCNELWGEKL